MEVLLPKFALRLKAMTSMANCQDLKVELDAEAI